MATEVTTDNKVTIEASAIVKFRDAQELLHNAEIWVSGAVDENDLASRRYRFHEMQDSFNRSMLLLMFHAQDYDGGLKVSGDSAPASFFWIHEKSGYHGGLIFHPSYRQGEVQPVGTWSIHT